MVAGSKAFSGFSVDDLAKAKAFYGDTLGLAVSEEPAGLSLEIAGGRHIFVYSKPDHTPATYTILNFPVPDIDAAVDDLTGRGVTFQHYGAGMEQDEKGIFRGAERDQGPNIAWFTDPAGNILSVIEEDDPSQPVGASGESPAMQEKDILDVINDPVSQRLINSTIPARLAYAGVDGFPRVIPVGFHWDGARFLVGSPDNAPKVKALRERPQVALTIDTEGMPPNVLLIRGVASVEVVDGVHDAFLDASRKRVSPEAWPEWEAGVRGLYKTMALIAIEPTWAKVLDFETRLPQPVEQLLKGTAG